MRYILLLRLTFKCYSLIGVISDKELMEIIKLIPLDCYQKICCLGQPCPQTSEETVHTLGGISHQHLSEKSVLTVLENWQEESQTNRREKLARILLNMGCYRAALKLDPTCMLIHRKIHHFCICKSYRPYNSVTICPA